jgi:GNAT superfamily N-acetyltransferase
MAVTVRRATRADADKIAEFSVALAGLHAGWDPQRFTKVVTAEGAVRWYGDRSEAETAGVFVAEDDGKVVGFAYFEYEPVLYTELATKVAWLDDIYVDPEARGSGAGQKLLAAVKEAARNLGANKILLSVAARNTLGQRFFQHNGFETTMLEMMLEIDDK